MPRLRPSIMLSIVVSSVAPACGDSAVEPSAPDLQGTWTSSQSSIWFQGTPTYELGGLRFEFTQQEWTLTSVASAADWCDPDCAWAATGTYSEPVASCQKESSNAYTCDVEFVLSRGVNSVAVTLSYYNPGSCAACPAEYFDILPSTWPDDNGLFARVLGFPLSPTASVQGVSLGQLRRGSGG